MRRTLLPLIVFALCAPLFAAGYRLGRHISIGGEGGWDYLAVDEQGNRLFVSHATQVDVIDLAGGRRSGVIEKTDGVHGIALAQDLGRGFISNGRAGTVTVFDLKDLRTVATWPATGENPDAILYDPASRRLLTFNGRGRNTTVFDAKSGAVVATIPLNGKPEFAVSKGDGVVYVNIEDTAELAEIDAREAKVLRRWPLAPCDAPTGLAIDRTHQRLFSVCENRVMVVSDAAAGRVIGTVPIGAGTDGAAFDKARRVVFSSNGADGTITVVREVAPDRYEAAQTVQTARGARTLALDGRTHRLYTATAKFAPPPSATPERPHPRPSVEPGTFEVIEVVP